MSLISVLMPTRNRMAFLPKAIESLQRQTLGHWELLVMDDASSDGTQAFITQAAQADPRIQYHRYPAQANQTHCGVPGQVRNQALRLAQGDWVFRLDDDDELAPHCFDLMHRYVTQHPYLNGIITTSLFIDKDSQVTGFPPNLRQHADGRFEFEDFPKNGALCWSDLYENIAKSKLPCPTMLVKTSALREIGGYNPELVYWEDAQMVVKLLMLDISGLHFLPEPVYHYRRHSGNITNQTAETLPRWVQDKFAFFQWLYNLPVLPPHMAPKQQAELENVLNTHLPKLAQLQQNPAPWLLPLIEENPALLGVYHQHFPSPITFYGQRDV